MGTDDRCGLKELCVCVSVKMKSLSVESHNACTNWKEIMTAVFV